MRTLCRGRTVGRIRGHARGRRRPARAFTLVEMVMVVMIIGMISSMAVPRISRGATGASDAALGGDLSIVRRAILYYAVEHNGEFPGPTAARFEQHLTQFSNAAAQISGVRTAAYPFGPYLHAIPRCPVGPNAGAVKVLIDAVNSPPKTNVASEAGWVYNPNTGEFFANVPGVVQHGTALIADIN